MYIYREEYWIGNALDNQLIFLLTEHYDTLKSIWKAPVTSLNNFYISHNNYLKCLWSTTFQKISSFFKKSHPFLHILPNQVPYYENLYIQVCVYSWSFNKMAQNA